MMPPLKPVLLLLLTSALTFPGAAAEKQKPHIVFVTGDHEYGSERTMPLLAKELEKNYGFRTTVLLATNEKGERDENYEKNIPGLEALTNANLAVFFLRWRLLPADQFRSEERRVGKECRL